MNIKEFQKTVYLMTILTLATFGMFTYPTLGPKLAAIYQWSPTQIGLLLTAFYVGATSTSVFGGYFVDRYGANRSAIAGLLLISLSIAAAIAPSMFIVKLLFLAVGGIGYALINPAINKNVVDHFAERIRGTVMSVKQMGLSLGGMLAAFILPLIVVNFSWQMAVVIASLCIFLFAAIVFALHKVRPKESVAENTTPTARHKDIAFKQILSNHNVSLISFSGYFLSCGQFILITYLVYYLQLDTGMDYVLASSYLAVLQFSGLVGRFVWGWSSDYMFRNRRNLFVTILFISTLLALLFIWCNGLLSPFLLGVLIFIMGVFTNGWNGLYMVILVESAPSSMAGKVTGLNLMFVYSGILSGPLLFGFLLQLIPIGTALYAIPFFFLVASLLLMNLRENLALQDVST